MASKVTKQQSYDRTGQSGLLAAATVAARLAGVAAITHAGLFFFSMRKVRH